MIRTRLVALGLVTALAAGSAASSTALAVGRPAVTSLTRMSALTAHLQRANHARTLNMHLVTRLHARPLSVAQQTTAPTFTSPQQLAMTPPANATNAAGGPVTPAEADAQQNPFGAFRPTGQTYTAAGMQGGYINAFTLPLAGTDTVTVGWLGTYYSTPAQAQAFLAATIAPFGANDVSCGTGCHSVALAIPNSTNAAIYAIVANGNAVGELLFILPQSALSTSSPDATPLTNVLSTVFGLAATILSGSTGTTGGTTTPTPTPTPTNEAIQISAIAVAHQSKGKLTATKSVKSGQQAVFVAYVTITNPGTDTPSVTATLVSKGKTLGTDTMQNEGSGPNGTTIYVDEGKFKVKKTVTVTLTVDATLGTSKDEQSLKFKVTKKAKKKK